jgi:hypothetical protein
MAAIHPRNFRRAAALVCIASWLAVGCGPSSLAMLFAPFVDDRTPPKYKLAKDDKEVTVVIASRFENLEVRPELMTADQELAEALAAQLRNRFKENKEKVKIVPPLRARPYLLKLKEWDSANLQKVAETFQADYVIQIDVQRLSLVMPNSYNSLYQGHADLEVTLYDAHQPFLEAVLHKELYRCEYPTSRPIDTTGSSPNQFRIMFVTKMARDLARWFTAYPTEQRLDMD